MLNHFEELSSRGVQACVLRAMLQLFSIVLSLGCATQPGAQPNGDSPVGSGGYSGVLGLGGVPLHSGSSRECIISADCAAGAHCDLGECVERCSPASPCPSGLVCSLRGRCQLEGAEAQGDPSPSVDKAGHVSVSPARVVVSEADRTLQLVLSSTSDEKVSYRVVVDAPYLSILESRGEFVGSTVLELTVDATKVDAVDVAGTVRIVTSLGELVVDAPLRVGLTGRYEGALRYTLGDVPLGQAQIVLDLQETFGDVRIKVDPERSLLFPPQDGKASYGEGLYTLSEGLEVTLEHTLSATAGGARNHFARDVGREITLHLQRSGQDVLEGTFEERIFGVFEQPVTASGTVHLRTRPLREKLEFEVPPPLSMPTVSAGSLSTAGFDALMAVPSVEELTVALGASNCGEGAGADSCLSQISQFYQGGLGSMLAPPASSADPIGDLRVACQDELYTGALTWAAAPAGGRRCSNAGGLVAVIRELALEHSPSAATSARLFHLTLARLLAPHLLVAQDDLVDGVRESFRSGPSGQAALYEAARTFLSAPARLLLEPRTLEFIRRTSIEGAQGEPSEQGGGAPDYPALRALGRLLYVLSSIEGELSSLAAADPIAERQDLLREAQERAVLTVLEASTLAALVEHWPLIPPGMGTELLGALSPLDRGFSTLLDGAVLFGVPEGEVPLSFDPSRVEPTNFEQMLLLRAAPALAQEAKSELSFLDATREFEQSQDGLAAELEQVRAGHDATIATICGPSFGFDVAGEQVDWELCGAEGAGTLAEARLQIELRQAEVTSAFSRIEGIRQRIAIEHETTFESNVIRDETLRFLSASGTERMAMAELENIINAAQIALEIASNSSLWNAGAPAAMGVVAGVLETTKGTFEVRRQELAMLQNMKLVEETVQLDAIQSAARIKSLLIDAAQLELDMEQLDIQLLQSLVFATGLLDAAKRAEVERRRVLARIEQSPAADPIYRTLMHDTLMQALTARREAQRALYRAGRALEYETNTPFGDALGRAVLAAHNHGEMGKLTDCFLSIHGDYAVEYGVPQQFKTTLSVRERLGVFGPRTDEVTGEELSSGELFRQLLLRNQNLDGQGGVELEFSTNLEPGNGLWSSGVCNDKIVAVRAMLVGDFLGDDEAEVQLTVAGGGVLRSCDGEQLVTWDIDSPELAVVQAGVNSLGAALSSGTLHGHAVARPRWRLAIPGAEQAPANADLDLQRLDDIVLEVSHEALPLRPSGPGPALSCLATIGAGG